MDYSKLNKILLNIQDPGNGFRRMSSDRSSDYEEEKNQGEEGLQVEIFDIQEPDIFMKVVTTSDSYGDDEKVTSIQFVTAQEKQITEFKEI